MPMGPGRTSPARRGHYPLPLNLLLLAAQPRGVRPLASPPPPFPLLVPRIPASEYRSYRARHGPCVPVVLRGGTAGLPTPAGAERLAESLLLGLSGEEVVVQRRRRRGEGEGGGGGEDATEWAAMTLGEAAGEAMDSDHWDAALAFCEGLLPPPGGGGEGEGRGAAEDLARTLRRAMGGPFRGGWGDDEDDDDDDNDEEEEEDWFDHFPPEARPSDAVVLAGEGATSTLHRDPFEWTGTSLCLEGSKLWRFVLPGGGGVEEVDGALESYRLASVAWDGGGGGDGGTTAATTTTPLSAGWQSDLTLYRHRAGGVPPARALAGLAGSDPAAYVRELEAIATGVGGRLDPCGGAREALGRMGGGGSTSSPATFAAAVQLAGDLLVIPAHCWHQTYAPEPSLAVASQRCGAEADGARVIGHVLAVAAAAGGRGEGAGGVPDILVRKGGYREGEGRAVVEALFGHLSGRGG